MAVLAWEGHVLRVVSGGVHNAIHVRRRECLAHDGTNCRDGGPCYGWRRSLPPTAGTPSIARVSSFRLLSSAGSLVPIV